MHTQALDKFFDRHHDRIITHHSDFDLSFSAAGEEVLVVVSVVFDVCGDLVQDRKPDHVRLHDNAVVAVVAVGQIFQVVAVLAPPGVESAVNKVTGSSSEVFCQVSSSSERLNFQRRVDQSFLQRNHWFLLGCI